MQINREIHLNVARPDHPITGTVVESRLLTDPKSPNIVRHVAIDVSGTPMEGAFQAGQAFGIIPEWGHYTEENKVSVASDDHTLRLYSISSPTAGEDGQGAVLATPVKRVITEHRDTHELFLGVASNYLCDLAVGERVKVTGPTGRQLLLPDVEERENHRYLLLATGTGVAPFRGMVRELLGSGCRADIWLILGVPYSTDVLYGDELRQLAEQHENFEFITAISREQKTGDGSKMYAQERLLERPEFFEPVIRDNRTLVYICGLKGMEAGIYHALLKLGGTDLVHLPDGEDAPPPSDLPGPREAFYRSIRPNRERTFLEVY